MPWPAAHAFKADLRGRPDPGAFRVAASSPLILNSAKLESFLLCKNVAIRYNLELNIFSEHPSVVRYKEK
jgi:hypothetical protein